MLLRALQSSRANQLTHWLILCRWSVRSWWMLRSGWAKVEAHKDKDNDDDDDMELDGKGEQWAEQFKALQEQVDELKKNDSTSSGWRPRFPKFETEHLAQKTTEEPDWTT